MKMKKIFSVLIALSLFCTMFVSLASVASAFTPESASVHPTITGRVTKVKSGKATVEFFIDSDADYSAEYEDDEYVGDTASGFSAIQVNLTLSTVVDDLFSGITAAKTIGNTPTLSGKSVTYAFGVSDACDYAQNGASLFKLTCTLIDSSMTLDQIKQYNLVASFDNLVVISGKWTVDDGVLDEKIEETRYDNQGTGDYSDVTGVYEYTASSATITGVTISPTSATVNGGESQTFTATVSGTGAYDSTVTYSATAGTITSAGVFTAPAATAVAQTITVTATSNGDNTKSATATVTVPAAAPTPTATQDLRGVVKGNDAADGQNTAVTKFVLANTVDPFVRIELGGDHKDYELPANVKGTASLIAILRYAKGTVGTFTIKVMDGASTLVETTHVATDE